MDMVLQIWGMRNQEAPIRIFLLSDSRGISEGVDLEIFVYIETTGFRDKGKTTSPIPSAFLNLPSWLFFWNQPLQWGVCFSIMDLTSGRFGVPGSMAALFFFSLTSWMPPHFSPDFFFLLTPCHCSYILRFCLWLLLLFWLGEIAAEISFKIIWLYIWNV